MRLKKIKLAMISSLVAVAFAGYGAMSAFAGNTGPVANQPSKLPAPICALMQSNPNPSTINSVKTRCDIAPATINHGDWHPCKDDANACGAGHSCCDGHCVSGSCS